MDWMTSEYNNRRTFRDMAVFTGKSVACGGSEGRVQATGWGLVICIREWALWKKINLSGKTYLLQGFGNVGSNAALLLAPLGMICIGVGDHTGYITCEEGFNIHRLSEYVKTNGSIEKYYTGTVVTKEQFFGTKCDFIIPAAMELEITKEIAPSINCTAIFEAANGPIDVEAEGVLAENGIDVVPDILCNSGGVVVSYYEWLQNLRHEQWTEEHVNRQLEQKMCDTFARVVEFAEENSCSFRCASYALAIRRLEHNIRQM